jgi:hypothetical protein
MYPIEITNQFIELRSREISLQRIAEQLGINKSTAVDWQRRYQAQIDELKAIHLDAVRERLATSYEDELEYAMTELKRIRAELKTRDWDFEPTTFLHHAEAAAYRRVQKLCALAEIPRGGRDATPLPSASSAVGRAMCPHSASAQSDIDRSAPSRLSVELAADPQTNPSEIQPFPNQNNGGSTSPAHRNSTPDPGTSPAPCVETESENPAKTQPFPGQNSGSHNPALSADQSKIENPNAKIAEPSAAEADWGGESVPVSRFESTREWLERQGIQVSKTPKGARVITAG